MLVSDLTHSWDNQDQFRMPALGRSASFLGPNNERSGFPVDRSTRSFAAPRRDSYYQDSSPRRVNSPSLKHNVPSFSPARAHSVNESKFRSEASSPGLNGHKQSQQQLMQAREHLLKFQNLDSHRSALGLAESYSSESEIVDSGALFRSKILEDFRNNRVARLELKVSVWLGFD